jgi:hypothetical protein
MPMLTTKDGVEIFYKDWGYAELPWEAQTAMAGPVWARLGARAVLEAYRAGPPIAAVPRGEGRTAASAV